MLRAVVCCLVKKYDSTSIWYMENVAMLMLNWFCCRCGEMQLLHPKPNPTCSDVLPSFVRLPVVFCTVASWTRFWIPARRPCRLLDSTSNWNTWKIIVSLTKQKCRCVGRIWKCMVTVYDGFLVSVERICLLSITALNRKGMISRFLTFANAIRNVTPNETSGEWINWIR